LPEICGDAAVLFDPDDPREIADAILRVRRDAASYVARGLDRIRGFTWAACADLHVEVFQEVTQGRRRRPQG
jgi:glycosyltransferase involved in cell wall biosynthesis